MPRHNHFSTFNLHEKRKKKQENDQQIIISLSAVVNTKSLCLLALFFSRLVNRTKPRQKKTKNNRKKKKKTKNKTEICKLKRKKNERQNLNQQGSRSLFDPFFFHLLFWEKNDDDTLCACKIKNIDDEHFSTFSTKKRKKGNKTKTSIFIDRRVTRWSHWNFFCLSIVETKRK